MEIKYLDLNEDNEYYEVEIWPYKCDRAIEPKYFTTLQEAKADFRKRTSGYEADCIKHHLGAAGYWGCEILK